VVKTRRPRTTNTLTHFPLPLFHFEDQAPPPSVLPTTPSRPEPATDGSDLIEQWFLDPELGECRVVGTGQHVFIAPGEGNLAEGVTLPPGWHQTLRYLSAGGTEETSSVTEVAAWIVAYPHPTPAPIPPSPALTLIIDSDDLDKTDCSTNTSTPAPTSGTSSTSTTSSTLVRMDMFHPCSMFSAGDPLNSAGESLNSAGDPLTAHLGSTMSPPPGSQPRCQRP
jgi:hypothetical protein